MNSKEIAVYKHYKSLYGSMLLLFRVQNNYEAYFDDAKSISAKLNIQLHTEKSVADISIPKVYIPASNVLDVISGLSNEGYEFKIQQRNETGEFDLPDINQLIREQNMDY